MEGPGSPDKQGLGWEWRVMGVRARLQGGAPTAHKRSLEAPACLCLPLQLREECDKFSGMSLLGMQEAPQSVFDY